MDKFTGDRRYIYHGNDGTNMPWNDTAQLDLLKAEVRESLIQTIMHVARKTPIIRFDAAMTLAKKHFQRLWFPNPGSGGAIPSRSDYAMTRSQFDETMPEEFWREVVDRINTEMPSTLLLAEAFWLMEGYFVRTLGMHRVYNSAFMHMLMKEENEKYRLLIKNTLEFNPEILKRYVNFMSNPDEETAVNQFGNGDKYFGVATMLVTLPGLPMFAHGQIEGFSEKYGMEYKRSYYDEFVDDNLIVRHEKEIFPLTKKRYLFSQVHNFELYDFIDQHGSCNENVFAFTNRSGSEVSLVLYNNSYSEAFGTINYSCERAYGEEGRTSTTTIDKALSINSGSGFYYIFKDHIQKLEFIISGLGISSAGFSFHLMGYQSKVLLEFREVYDADGKYKILHDQLNGRGVYSIEHALSEMNLAPFHNSLVHLFTSIKFSRLILSLNISSDDEIEIPTLDDEIIRIYNHLKNIRNLITTHEKLIENIETDFSLLKNFNNSLFDIVLSKRSAKWIGEVKSIIYPEGESIRKKELSFLLFNKILFRILKSIESDQKGPRIFDELLLWKPIFEIFGHMRFDDPGKYYELSKVLFVSDFTLLEKNVITIKINQSGIKSIRKSYIGHSVNLKKYFIEMLENDWVNNFIQVNKYDGIKYFNKERIEEFIRWHFKISTINQAIITFNNVNISKKSFSDFLKGSYQGYIELLNKISKSEYKVENLLLLPEVKIVKKLKSAKQVNLKKSSVKKTSIPKIKPEKEKKLEKSKKTKTKKKTKSRSNR